MANPFVPSEQIKSEIESLIRQSLQDNDVATQEQLFHMIADKTNELRQRHGLPRVIDPEAQQVTLKSPTDQLHAAGVSNELVMGTAVFNRANAPNPTNDDQLCMFDQCFVDTKNAEEFRGRVMRNVLKHMKRANVRIYPPLLLRATRDEVVGVSVDAQGHVHRSASMEDRNMLLVMFKEGAIIPVVDKDQHARFRSVIQVIYALQGTTDAQSLETTLTQ